MDSSISQSHSIVSVPPTIYQANLNYSLADQMHLAAQAYRNTFQSSPSLPFIFEFANPKAINNESLTLLVNQAQEELKNGKPPLEKIYLLIRHNEKEEIETIKNGFKKSCLSVAEVNKSEKIFNEIVSETRKPLDITHLFSPHTDTAHGAHLPVQKQEQLTETKARSVSPLASSSASSTGERIDFNAKLYPSRGPNSIRAWMIREIALAILSLFVIVMASYAIADPSSLSNVIQLNMTALPHWAYACLLTAGVMLGFRTLLWRPLVMWAINKWGRRAFYPIQGREIVDMNRMNEWPKKIPTQHVPIHPSWNTSPDDKTDFTLQTYDNNLIRGCLLARTDRNPNRKGIMVLCFGNGVLYDSHDLNDSMYNKIRQEGYDLLLYHPPGYGSSSGVRTPQSDFFALEAALLYLNKTHRVPFSSIHLQCQSIGTGSGGAIAAQYPLGSIKFVVPLARSDHVAERLTNTMIADGRFIPSSPWRGKIASFLLGSTLQNMMDYDNIEAIRHTKVKEIEIQDGEKDKMMTTGELVPEAALMAQAWIKAFSPGTSLTAIPPHTHELKTNRVDVVNSNGYHLIYSTWKDLDHNDIRFPVDKQREEEEENLAELAENLANPPSFINPKLRNRF